MFSPFILNGFKTVKNTQDFNLKNLLIIYRAIKVLCYSHNFQNSFLDIHFGAKKFQQFFELVLFTISRCTDILFNFCCCFLLASSQQNSKENSRHLILNLLNLKYNFVHCTFHKLDRMKNICTY